MTGEPSHLRVRNWHEFQHYKDRSPPWIKLHFALLASEDWVTLDDASKLLAVVCMLIASRNEGVVPNNPAYLKRVAYLDRLPKLKPLIDCGFLEIPQADASTMQAPASAPQADARPEKSRKEEEKKESSSPRGKRVAESDDLAAEFEGTFWPAYPLKKDKPDSLKAYRKARAKASLETIMAGLKAFAAEVVGKDRQFVRHAPRWLNAESWNNQAGTAPIPDKPATPDDWRKRLMLGRSQGKWSTPQWGPMPGLPGCRVPSELVNESDGQGWREWEQAT